MKEISKWRRFCAIWLPIFFTISKYKTTGRIKREFMVRKRILHKGYQILEVTHLKDGSQVYELVTNCRDWDKVIEIRTQIRTVLSRKDKFRANLEDLTDVEI